MKNLDEMNVLAVIIRNNLIGGYFLEIADEKMKVLFKLNSVDDYASYVRVNRDFIEATMWFTDKDVSIPLMDKVYSEVNNYPDLLMPQGYVNE